MNQATVIIQHQENLVSSIPMISVSNCIMKKLKLPTHIPLYVQTSKLQYQVGCRLNSAKGNIMQIHTSLAKSLGIPDQAHLHLNYNPHTLELKFAPIFAILVSDISKREPPFSELNMFCKEVLSLARHRYILAYVVTIQELLKDDELVTGWTFSKNKWEEKKFPYPRVLYNRISSRRIENTKSYQELKEKMNKQKMYVFNKTFLNKWKVHEQLSQHKPLTPFLPHTQLFQGPLTLKVMLERYPTIFIKPIHGSLGQGIYRICKRINGFDTQYTIPNGQIQKHFGRLSELYSYLGKRIKRNKFIIQQGVPLLYLNERAVDFRALMQKNDKGEWSTTSMVARIGPENRFVSNIASGGELQRVVKTLRRCKVANPKQSYAKLLQVAKKTCVAIDEANGSGFGELGVDLAISSSGKIYLLEINSKPSKSEDTVPLSSSKGRPSVHRLLDYTLYLTKLAKNEV